MSEKRKIAGAILDKAKTAVTTQRGQQHGDAESSFAAIGMMWATYINATQIRRTGIPLASLYISPTDVAFMMDQMKQMRVLYGDETDPDNYLDAAGYVALAGSFSVPAARVMTASGVATATPEQPPVPVSLTTVRFENSVKDGREIHVYLSDLEQVTKDFPVPHGHEMLVVGKSKWPKGSWEPYAYNFNNDAQVVIIRPVAKD